MGLGGDPGASLPRALREAAQRSAAPAIVSVALERLAEASPELPDRLADDPRLASALLAVVEASRSLTRLIETDRLAIDVLADLERPPDLPISDTQALARSQRLELLRIAARDLTGTDGLEEVGAALAALASRTLEGACTLAAAEHLAVVGMGKLAGDELNYASDVDVMFVGEGDPPALERAARAVMDAARHCFRIDADLRPEGRAGQLVRTTEGYETYWERWAQPWERQALLKARPVAGDPALGERFARAADRWLWHHPLSADDLRSIRNLKSRAEQEVARRGLTDRDLKRGRGGIRDIEFSVQLLQLVHGQVDPELRTPNTLEALRELADAGYVDDADAEELAHAYRFLRTVEHRLQLVDEQQVHSLPEDPAALDRLARVLGFRDEPRADAPTQLRDRLRSEQLAVRLIHERLYFRPLLEAFAGVESALTPEAAGTRLSAFGFTDAQRTQDAVRELTRGLNRTSRLMQQLLPLLLDWLSQSPDPDLGLLQLRKLLSGPRQGPRLAEAFRESPEVARRLCSILGTSRMLGELLARNPDVIPRLADHERLRTRPRAELVESARAATSWRSALDARQEGLRRWTRRHLLGVAARDLLDASDIRTIGRDLTALAEAALEVALESLEPPVPVAVVAMGRFGGAELSYASDLDVVLVHGGEGPDAVAEAERVGRELLRFVSGATPAERIYEIDADLRPEGRQGPLVRSLEGFVTYSQRWAQTWERQAYLRARPVAGDLELGATLVEALAQFVWDGGLSPAEVREIRRIKARVEAERIPVGEDPEFHLKLGPGSLSDVEWATQLLQLRHGVRAEGTMDALDRLVSAGVLAPEDGTVLGEAYEFLERTRNRLSLVQGDRSDALPSQPEPLRWLARSLDLTPSELRDTYRRVTRRCRRVFERIFYETA